MLNTQFYKELGNLDHFFRQPLPICEWAEENLIVRVSDRAGRLRLDPYQRGILEAFTNPDVRQVTMMCSSQLGKTLLEAVYLGWIIDQNPQPCLFMHASQVGLNKFIREKLEPILMGCESINQKVFRNNRGKIPLDGFSFEGNGYFTMTTPIQPNTCLLYTSDAADE